MLIHIILAFVVLGVIINVVAFIIIRKKKDKSILHDLLKILTAHNVGAVKILSKSCNMNLSFFLLIMMKATTKHGKGQDYMVKHSSLKKLSNNCLDRRCKKTSRRKCNVYH